MSANCYSKYFDNNDNLINCQRFLSQFTCAYKGYNSGCFVFCFVADTIYFLSENDLKQQNKIFFLLLLSYINILS